MNTIKKIKEYVNTLSDEEIMQRLAGQLGVKYNKENKEELLKTALAGLLANVVDILDDLEKRMKNVERALLLVDSNNNNLAN